MPPRQVAYLLDIFRSIQAIQEYLAGYSHQQFLQDARTQDAVRRRLLVVGEAAVGWPTAGPPSQNIFQKLQNNTRQAGLILLILNQHRQHPRR